MWFMRICWAHNLQISWTWVTLNAPINGMPHLAYLGQMLEKEGEFGIGIFPKGLVLSLDCMSKRVVKYMNSPGA